MEGVVNAIGWEGEAKENLRDAKPANRNIMSTA